ncbi:MAG: hypothetical protein ACLR23_27680 [Clostridia bacterium]
MSKSRWRRRDYSKSGERWWLWLSDCIALYGYLYIRGRLVLQMKNRMTGETEQRVLRMPVYGRGIRSKQSISTHPLRRGPMDGQKNVGL